MPEIVLNHKLVADWLTMVRIQPFYEGMLRNCAYHLQQSLKNKNIRQGNEGASPNAKGLRGGAGQQLHAVPFKGAICTRPTE